MRACSAPGCSDPLAYRFSPYCNFHKARLRRHGAVDQEAITKAHLKPYSEIIRQRVAGNAESPAWGKLDARWRALVSAAAGMVAAYRNGTPSIRWEVHAAEEIVRLGEKVEAREAWITVAAMFLMRELEARRFRTDAGFATQLVRRVRGLTEANSTGYRDPRTGKARRTYHELSPRAAAVMALWLSESLGLAGLHIARLEQDERAAKERERLELHAALGSVA